MHVCTPPTTGIGRVQKGAVGQPYLLIAFGATSARTTLHNVALYISCAHCLARCHLLYEDTQQQESGLLFSH